MLEAKKRGRKGGTHRSEEERKWYSMITSKSPELSGCSSETSNPGCSEIDY
jgi:hypothetical protein